MAKKLSKRDIRNLLWFRHNGQDIYFCLRWCNTVTMHFIYATAPEGIRSQVGDLRCMFDVREQIGGEKLDPIRSTKDEHMAVIKAALDVGKLRSTADVHHGGENPVGAVQ